MNTLLRSFEHSPCSQHAITFPESYPPAEFTALDGLPHSVSWTDLHRLNTIRRHDEIHGHNLPAHCRCIHLHRPRGPSACLSAATQTPT